MNLFLPCPAQPPQISLATAWLILISVGRTPQCRCYSSSPPPVISGFNLTSFDLFTYVMCNVSGSLPSPCFPCCAHTGCLHCCEQLWLLLLGTRLFAVVFCRDEFPAVCSLLFNFLSDYYTNCFWCLLRWKRMNQNNGAGGAGESGLCCSGVWFWGISLMAASSGCSLALPPQRDPAT